MITEKMVNYRKNEIFKNIIIYAIKGRELVDILFSINNQCIKYKDIYINEFYYCVFSSFFY